MMKSLMGDGRVCQQTDQWLINANAASVAARGTMARGEALHAIMIWKSSLTFPVFCRALIACPPVVFFV